MTVRGNAFSKLIIVLVLVVILSGCMGSQSGTSRNDTNISDNSSNVQMSSGDQKPRDTDSDGLNDKREEELGTDKTSSDTDGDSLSDSAEINEHGTNPGKRDTDGDSLSDSSELQEHSTDPVGKDTEGDGLSDSTEIQKTKTDPTLGDTDQDGLSDEVEINEHETDPNAEDTDGDTLTDKKEVNINSNPKKKDSNSDGFGDSETLKLGLKPGGDYGSAFVKLVNNSNEKVRKLIFSKIKPKKNSSDGITRVSNHLLDYNNYNRRGILQRLYLDGRISETEFSNLELLASSKNITEPPSIVAPLNSSALRTVEHVLDFEMADWDGDKYNNSIDKHPFRAEDSDGDGVPNKDVDSDHDGKTELLGESSFPGDPDHASRYYYICPMKRVGGISQEAKRVVKNWWKNIDIKNPDGSTGVNAYFIKGDCELSYTDLVTKDDIVYWRFSYKPKKLPNAVVFTGIGENIETGNTVGYAQPRTSTIGVEKQGLTRREVGNLILHEDGHVLGFGHVNARRYLMNPYLSYGTELTAKQRRILNLFFRGETVDG